MGHKHKNRYEVEKPQGGLFDAYRRLLGTYALRHWLPFFLGVTFAVVEGGALLALCRMVGLVATGLEGGGERRAIVTVQEEAPSQTLTTEDGATLSPEKADIAVLPDTKRPGGAFDRQTEKIGKYVDSANGFLRKLGLPEVDKGDGVHLTHGIVMVMMLGLALFFVLQALATLGNRYCLKWLGARVVTDMRGALFNHLMDQSQAFYSRHDMAVGTLISRCTNDINAVEGIISTSFPELIVAPVQILAAGTYLVMTAREANLDWKFGLIVILLLACIFPVYALCRLLKRFEHRVLDGVAKVTDRMQESFSGMKVIRAFHQEEHEKGVFSKVNEGYFKALRRAIRAEIAVPPLLQLAAMIVAAVFVWLCYINGLTLGILGGMAFAAQSMYKPIKDLVKVNAGLQRGAAAAERFFQVLDEDASLPVPANPVRLKEFRDEIVFHEVSFRYTADGQDVLHGLNLTVRKGEMVALVGQTGSGKSTVANLLARFYDPTSGAVTIDGVDLRQVDIGDFRNLVGVVSQDTFLFNTTIEENIRYGRPEATHEEVVEAARQAKALDFIEEHPDGFQRQVGERGDLLSGGQKQRVAIARAILRNPPILILDEATSALDTVTERLVQEALNNVMKNRTVLAIAHRLSTVRSASCILVMEDGRVLEKGTDAELRQKGGFYSRLAQMQFQEQPEGGAFARP